VAAPPRPLRRVRLPGEGVWRGFFAGPAAGQTHRPSSVGAMSCIQRDASVASVARRLGVEWHTVWQAIKPLLARKRSTAWMILAAERLTHPESPMSRISAAEPTTRWTRASTASCSEMLRAVWCRVEVVFLLSHVSSPRKETSGQASAFGPAGVLHTPWPHIALISTHTQQLVPGGLSQSDSCVFSVRTVGITGAMGCSTCIVRPPNRQRQFRCSTCVPCRSTPPKPSPPRVHRSAS
jgi:hypothetical protein